MSQTNQITLFELNEHVRQVIALNFSEAIWVSAELAQVNLSKGHYWIDIIEKSELTGDIIAQSSAVLWRKAYLKLRTKMPAQIEGILQQGRQVLLQVNVEFSERYGYKLIITDIDPAFTLGKLELERQATINTLIKANLIQKNKQVPRPPVLQKIAVISSENAAGYHDFCAQINNNPYSYSFNYQLFKAAMQGVQTEYEVLAQLARIAEQKERFDAVIIIRGGGAKLDLAAFDSLEIAKAVANFPLPVFAGIGHEIDETVLDLVANYSLKTPTAVAEFLVQYNAQFEGALEELKQLLQQHITNFLQQEQTDLAQAEQIAQFTAEQHLSKQDQLLDYIEKEVPALTKFQLRDANTRLNNLEKMVDLLKPEVAFKRGFSLTMKGKKTVISKKELKKGEEIITHFQDGKVKSKVV